MKGACFDAGRRYASRLKLSGPPHHKTLEELDVSFQTPGWTHVGDHAILPEATANGDAHPATARLTDPTVLPAEPLISAVTLAELSVGPLVAETPGERAARQAHLQLAETDFASLPFDAAAARAFGRVASCLRRAGRKSAARSHEAMIAATALANDLPLYTCNPDDLRGIDELQIIGIPVPETP